MVDPILRPNQPAVRASQRKQRWCNLCIKTCTAEVFRPASILNHQLAPNASEPRPARTPPSTFLFLHLNLSNNPMHEASPSPKGRNFVRHFILKTVRLCSEEHQRPEGSEPLELPEEGSNPLFQNNSRRLSEEHTSKSSWKKTVSSCFQEVDASSRQQTSNRF